MAPLIKRGKIKSQVYGDVSSATISVVMNLGETLGIIRNNPTNGAPRGGGGRDGFNPRPDGNINAR